ncbi:MAG: DUF1800 domain-containing protein [Actinomycetes bacterium]
MTPPSQVARRDVFRVAFVGAAVAASGAVSSAASPPAAASGPLLTTSTNMHLLRRLTYGPSPAAVAEIESSGPQGWLRAQLNPSVISDSVCAGYLARYPRLNWSIPQARANLDGGAWDLMSDLGQATLLRMVWSRRQLFEVMVEFWSNHLNITNPSSDVWDNRHDYDRTVIRAYALGKFSDLLWASATHPAMMRYLNNADSVPPDFNENYGRELLELHTVGVDAGYTEVDMRSSALIMSGFGVHDVWRPDGQPQDPKNGLFEYQPDNHYVGPVQVMGFTNPNPNQAGGFNVGKAYVSYLAHHPAAARRIADKLVMRFISDDPMPKLSAALVKTYLAADTAIVPVLQQLFASLEFRTHQGTKVKRPVEDLVSSCRTLSITPDPGSGTDGLQALWWESDSLGHMPLAWPMPNGYSDVAVDWQSTNQTLERWNLHMALAGQWWPVANVDPKNPQNTPMLQAPALASYLPSPLPTTYAAFVDAMAQRLVYQKMAPPARDAVVAFLGKTPSSALKSTDAAVTWKLPYVVALILDSVYHALR